MLVRNCFDLCEKLETVPTALSSDAALLNTSERGAQVAQQPAVHPHQARAQRFGDAGGAMTVEAPQRRRKAVINMVGHAHHFLFRVEGVQGDNGAEDLLARSAARVRQA